MTRFGHGFLSGLTGNDAFTKILLHMDGSNGGTSFIDSNAGGSAHTWTATSVTTSATQVKFGSASLSDAAAGSIRTPDHVDFTLGSGDFTIDTWFWVAGGAGANRFFCGQCDASASDASIQCGINLSNQMFIFIQGGVFQVVGTTTFTTPGWHHYAVVRTGNILKMFIDGVQEGGNVSITVAVHDSASSFAVGGEGNFNGVFWNGFIDEFRLSVGIARWTANFTPPVAPYG